MAIFGDLADMLVPEVLTILGRRTGKLLLSLPGHDRYELHLCEATLWSFQVSGVTQTELPVVFSHLAVLNRIREGRFEFVVTSPGALDHQLDLPRQELLARDDGGDEVLGHIAIPDKQTRFRLKPGPSQPLPENLEVFLQRAQALLLRGSSAEEVAQVLDMSAMRAQIYFQRLRELGQLTPIRAFHTELETQSADEARAAPLLPRPLPSRPALARDAYANATPDKPARSFVRRLLSVLTLGALR